MRSDRPVGVGRRLLTVGAWRSLVAHLLWVQGVPSSNLGAPIRRFE